VITKCKKHIEGDRVAGVRYMHSIECPVIVIVDVIIVIVITMMMMIIIIIH